MAKIKQHPLLVVLLAFIALSTPGSAGSAGFNQFVGFGDSTLDSGYFRYNTTGNQATDQGLAVQIARGDTGAFVGNGVENSIILAGKFGLSAAPVGDGTAEPIMPTVAPIRGRNSTLAACPLSSRFRTTLPLSTALPIPCSLCDQVRRQRSKLFRIPSAPQLSERLRHPPWQQK